jgi:hypothetical protein
LNVLRLDTIDVPRKVYALLSAALICQRLENWERPVRVSFRRQYPLREAPAAVGPAELRKNLVKHFSDSELRDLCFDLVVDYDVLPGVGKGDKARELIAYLERRGRISELVEACRQRRPNESW